MRADISLRRDQSISVLKNSKRKSTVRLCRFLGVFSRQEQGSVPGSGGCPDLSLHPLLMKGRCDYPASCLTALRLKISSGASKS